MSPAPASPAGRLLSTSLAVLMAWLCSSPALAHDLWLHVEPPQPGADTQVQVSLRIGERGEVESMAFDPLLIDTLLLRTPEATATLPLTHSRDHLLLRPGTPGSHAIGYIGAPSLSELPPEEFDHYLGEEHLDAIAAERRRQPASDAAVREQFSRSLKALLHIGNGPIEDCPLGLPLEITLLQSDGKTLLVQARFEGRPLPGLWLDRGDSSGRVLEEHRTDANGRARFAASAGEWILRATHMEVSATPGVAWRSWWASTRFYWDGAQVGRCASQPYANETAAS